VFTWLQPLATVLLLILVACVAYLLLFTVAAQGAKRVTRLHAHPPTRRFLLLIPAHNEETLLPALVDNLQRMEYPAALRVIHVVADNCSDGTAAAARAHGAQVHERSDPARRGKGYALQWLLQRLWEAEEPHDAVVILDADSIVSPNFLRVMDSRLARGERVIQAHYAVRDAGQAWSAGLRYAALAVLHYLRPQARMVLGGSAGLKGNGMVFGADILRRHAWSAALTEDIELHMELLLAGERVTFAPDAVVKAEMPHTLASARTQNVRWERGRWQMARRYVPRLLRAAWAARREGNGRFFLLLDAVMEHLIPPFSLLAAGGALLLALAALLPAPPAPWAFLKPLNVGLGTAVLLGQALYLFSGLRMTRAPRSVYLALLFAPVFVVWKLWLLSRVALGRDRAGWVRTARNQA
jgi:1,2-diacylglycerol 3-beta-glucosyltransferase